MDKQDIDGIEIEQKLMESLDIGERFNFSNGGSANIASYEKRESSVAALYKKYKHVIVNSKDELFGANDGEYEFIQTAKGLYKDLQNPGRI